MPAAIDLAAVSRVFGAVPALRRVSLTVAEGETVLLRGPNGAGKTTLLHVIATVLSPTLGAGQVLGHDLVAGRAAIRAHTDLLGHRARLYDDLTTAENLRLTCRLHRRAENAIPAALDRVGLRAVADDRVRGFSPGMRQRVSLARLLLRRPALMLLDEPYAAIDDSTKALVDEMLTAARANGCTIVVSTHDGDRVGWADRLVEMSAGGVVRDRSGAR